MKTTEQTITLESLGLKCTIVSQGVSKMNDDDKSPMLAWNAMFTNSRGQSQSFDYFTGLSCVDWAWAEKRKNNQAIFTIHERNILGLGAMRWRVKDRKMVSDLAAKIAFLTNFKPNPIEILWAVAMDCDALDSSFEDWASDFGYDADSRKAEKIYHACQDNGHKLRKLLSREQIQQLREMEM